MAFLLSLMQQQFSSHYVMKTLAGISFFFKLEGLQPCSGYFSVRQALKGYRRRSLVPDSRRPISVELLGGLCGATKLVCFSEYEALLFNTAFSFAFFGAFRISELVPANKKESSGISYEQVVVDQFGVRVWLQHSKMAQAGRGCLVNLQAQENVLVCPVALVQRFLGAKPPVGGQFFIHANLEPLTKYQFDSVLQKCLNQLGLQNFRFSSHSFRIGAASEAARKGLSETAIMEMGRWKLKCFKLYVRPNLFI